MLSRKFEIALRTLENDNFIAVSMSVSNFAASTQRTHFHPIEYVLQCCIMQSKFGLFSDCLECSVKKVQIGLTISKLHRLLNKLQCQSTSLISVRMSLSTTSTSSSHERKLLEENIAAAVEGHGHKDSKWNKSFEG